MASLFTAEDDNRPAKVIILDGCVTADTAAAPKGCSIQPAFGIATCDTILSSHGMPSAGDCA